MRSWLIALRVARREARRAAGRTALIVLMIGLPVLGLTFAAVTYTMEHRSPEEAVTRMMGSADGLICHPAHDTMTLPDGTVVTSGMDATQEDISMASSTYQVCSDDGPHDAATILPLLPAGSSATEFWQSLVTMNTANGIGDFTSYGVDTTSPITRGLWRLMDGRVPATTSEAAISPSGLARLGAHVGSTVTTVSGRTFTVVGVMEIAGRIEDAVVTVPAASLADSKGVTTVSGVWLVKLPSALTWPQIQQLNQHGYIAQSRDLVLHPPAPPPGDVSSSISVFGAATIVAGLGLLEVVLLAGPAFAVGAKRRQRDLALVAANGGTPGALRRIVLADGVIGGLLAAVVASVAGVAIAYAARGWVEEHIFHERFVGYRFNPLWQLVIVAIALFTGIAGALVPAFTAARQDVVLALAGRRGAVRSRVIWLVLGIAGIALGGAVAAAGAYRHSSNIVLGGLVIGELGIVLCTPTIVGQIAKLGRFLPLTPRIALRDASRRRAAAAPAISAVMAAVAGTIALTVYLNSTDHQMPTYIASVPMGSIIISPYEGYPGGKPSTPSTADPFAGVDDAIHTVFPGIPLTRFNTMSCDGYSCSVQATLPVDRRCPYDDRMRSDGVLTKDDMRKALADPRCAERDFNVGYGSPQVVTDDPAVVSAFTGLTGAKLDEAVATLRAGGVLISEADYVENGRTLLSGQFFAPQPDRTAPGDPNAPQPPDVSVPAYVVPVGGGSSQPILSPKIAESAHRPVVPGGIIGRPATVPTQAQQDKLDRALYRTATQSYFETGDHQDRGKPIALILAIAAGVVALGAAGIATGLAAADSRHDLTTLGAVGAAPRVRRLLSLSQSGIISGLGAVLGAVAGFGAAAAVLTGLNQQYAGIWPRPTPYLIEVPWTNLLISLVVVPIVAMAGAGLLTRSRLPSERRVD